MASLKIIFAGAGAFGLPTLRALIGENYEIVQVITQPDRPAGRGRKMTATPIGELAMEKNLPLVRTENINALALPAADVMVVIAFGQKISPEQVNHPRLASVNLHASLLPKFRGAAPINWAILNGEIETGNSVIRLAEKMDAGAILGQSRLQIGEGETTGELHDRLAVDGGPLMLRVLEDLAAGRAEERAQDESLATIAPKLSRQNAVLDFNQPAEKIARQICGLSPWPGCRVRVVEGDREVGRLTVLRAIAETQSVPEKPGLVESRPLPGTIQPDGSISCGGGTIEILDVQPEGKSPMSLSAYQNGRPWAAGARLEALVN